MSTLNAGADGCKAGWLCVSRADANGPVTAVIYATAADLIYQSPRPDALMVDIPIGLPDAYHRDCDVAARRLIGPRRSSVFPSPIRPAIGAATRQEASALTQAVDGRSIGAQAWGIFPKVHDVDAVLSADPALQHRVFEVHPEVCFWDWSYSASGRGITHAKKDRAGVAERMALVNQYFGPDTFQVIRSQFPRSIVADDDILDAAAALRAAEKHSAGRAVTIPAQPPADANGLLMRMVY